MSTTTDTRPTTITTNRGAWRLKGTCAQPGIPADLWTDVSAGNRSTARHICLEHCPVLAECDRHAQPDSYWIAVVAGVYYGRSGKALKQPLPAFNCFLCSDHQPVPQLTDPTCSPGRGRPPAPCGTESAFKRHRAVGEPIDDLCRTNRNLRSTAAKRAARKAQQQQVV